MTEPARKEFGCLILAAGEAKRMGTQKLLLEFRGKPILQHVVDLALSLEFSEIVAVVGGYYDELLGKINFGRAKLVVNQEYRMGLSTSLKLGLSSFNSKPGGYVVMLGDQPLVQRETLIELMVQHRAHGSLMTIPVYKGQRGNPVILDSRILDEINTLSGDVGAKKLIEKHLREVLWVHVDDPGVLLDVDTPEDYRRLLEKVGKTDSASSK